MLSQKRGDSMTISLRPIVLLALILILAFGSGVSAQLAKVKAAYSVQSSWLLATWVVYEAGFFQKYGLDVDLVLIRATPIVTAAMIAGEAPIGRLAGSGPVSAALQGADSVYFATLVSLIPQSFVVTADINKAGDLKGKRFGGSRFGASRELVGRKNW